MKALSPAAALATAPTAVTWADDFASSTGAPYSIARWRAYLDAHPPATEPDVRLEGTGWTEFWATRPHDEITVEARRWDAPIRRPADPYPYGARLWRLHRKTRT